MQGYDTTTAEAVETPIAIPLNASTLGAEEMSAVQEALASGQLTMGPRCAEFERQFAAYIGARHAVMVNSGSSANLLALFAIANPLCPLPDNLRQLRPGDEVIAPAVTWSTTIWPIIQAGGVPVLVDSDPATLQTRPEAIEAAITDRTVAICIVHVLGGAVEAQAVRALAHRRRLWLIEDTCEALGVKRAGRFVGTFGHLGTYSFYFSHHITTIEGGMVVCDDDELADLLRALRAHGWIRHMRKRDEFATKHPDIDPRFLFVTTGFNVRPTEINAAIGQEQLKKLAGFNQRRRDVAVELDTRLTKFTSAGHFSVMQFDADAEPAPFGYPVICRDPQVRAGLARHLERSGIETRPII
jgi:CDP-6-deoxy-D-xylo-4-hexulose-3-dehydrase